MNRKSQSVGKLVIVTMFALALLWFQGCKKEEPVAQQPAESNAAQSNVAAKEAAEEATTQVAAAVEQTTCPVMDGNPINKDLFVEYEGKKVYFCCKGCEEKFMADPEKYLAKLPQFQK